MPSHLVFHLAMDLGPSLAVWVVSLLTMDVSTHRLSPVYHFPVFGVCYRGVDRNDPPNDYSALPPEVSARGTT